MYGNKGKKSKLPVSPRVAEILELSEAVKRAFRET
jgi:hypothetical protein